MEEFFYFVSVDENVFIEVKHVITKQVTQSGINHYISCNIRTK
jgi:hypothetical protein